MPDAVLLPNRKVLALNGSSRGHADNGANPVWEAELYDPDTNTWTTMAEMSVPRLYHATALLLPDGRVMTAGTDVLWNPDPFHEAEKRVEIFSPPYLFQGPRPSISNAPAEAAYGSEFTIGTPDAGEIDEVALLRCGSTTHSFNSDQRYVGLAIASDQGGELRVKAPPNGYVAPPGYYMLFLLRHGVPSTAHFIRIGASVLARGPATARRPPYVRLLWGRRLIRDPRTGIPLPVPIDPENCPICRVVLVDPGAAVTDVRIAGGRVEAIAVDRGEIRVFDLAHNAVPIEFRVERTKRPGEFGGLAGVERIRRERGTIHGLVIEGGKVRALIGGTGKLPEAEVQRPV
jgi:hypothetical protein